jgi:hypothetical protein
MTAHASKLPQAIALGAALFALAGCQSTTSGSSSTGGSVTGGNPAPSLNGESEPAAQTGYCIVGPHTIANETGLVTGTLSWECHGPVLMTLTVRLIYVGNNAEREIEVDEGRPVSVNNVTDTSPIRLTAPCTSGLWKLKIVGSVTGTGATPLTLNTSDKVNPPFNDAEWQNPTTITC